MRGWEVEQLLPRGTGSRRKKRCEELGPCHMSITIFTFFFSRFYIIKFTFWVLHLKCHILMKGAGTLPHVDHHFHIFTFQILHFKCHFLGREPWDLATCWSQFSHFCIPHFTFQCKELGPCKHHVHLDHKLFIQVPVRNSSCTMVPVHLFRPSQKNPKYSSSWSIFQIPLRGALRRPEGQSQSGLKGRQQGLLVSYNSHF